MNDFEKEIATILERIDARLFSWYEREPEGHEDGGGFVLVFHVDGEPSSEECQEVYACVSRWYSSSCHHEYDCCGCAHAHSWFSVDRGFKAVLIVDVGLNY